MCKKRAEKVVGPKISERANTDLSVPPELIQPSSLKSRLNVASEHKKPFKIKDRYTGLVLFETEAETLKDAVEEAVELQVNLSFADLRNADLGGAYLAQAELSGADFSGANLFNVTLWRATLTGARFCNVDLRYANFKYANLKKAVLRNSKLICTRFLESNLTQADLRGSDSEGADLWNANITNTFFDPRPMAPEEGSFLGWKMVYDIQGDPLIAEVLIPEDAKRMTLLIGRACRAEFVKVLKLSRDVPIAKCKFNADRIYAVGETVRTLDHGNDSDLQVGVSQQGLHFYLTREETRLGQLGWYPPIIPTAKYWKSAVYRGWVDGTKCLNQPDNQEGKWRAGVLFDATAAKLMNQWDEEQKL